MSTAEKLTYLNDTKQLLKENINNLGGNLTTEPFRQYASVLEGIYERLPKVSGIGASLSLSPTMVGRIKLNEIQGNSVQDETPTPDTPVPIQSVTGLQNVEVCGKNLLDVSKCINGYINASGGIGESNYDLLSDYIKVESGKNYTISINTQFYNIGYAFYDSSKTYITRYNTNRNITTLTITIPSGTSYIRVWFNLDGTTALTPTNILQYEPMIEQGSTATEYEEYKGNTYEVNLGKNLCNNALFVADSGATINSYTDNSISVTFVGTYKAATQFINISNSIYTFSIGNISNNKGRMEVYLYNNGEQVGTKQNVTANQTYTIDNTSGLGDQIRLTLSNSDLTQTNEITFDNIQLEKGSTSTSFSPYFTPIELNKIGDYKDRIYKDNGKWYEENQIDNVILDGSEEILYDGASSTPTQRSIFRINIGNNPVNSDYISNRFVKGSSTSNRMILVANNNKPYISLDDTITGINTSDTNTEKINKFKTWLSSNNVELIYPLATPTYTEITNTELIEDLETLYTAKSQEGTTNISITSEDLEMILNVSALKGDA